ncbi:MAG: NlpC/P60 family protein, partial [Deltaproteobacteria bacterium]|nr:NlpC/P60 family protein [Deltaproteobacteria bacterium]
EESGMKDKDIAAAAQRLIDSPYSLGDDSKGWNCLSMIWHFYGTLGISLPREFKGFSAENYAERWKKGEGREELHEYLMGLGQPVEPNYERNGDLLIFDAETWVFPGIYLGSGHFLAAYERGTMCCPFKFFRKSLRGIRRLGRDQARSSVGAVIENNIWG